MRVITHRLVSHQDSRTGRWVPGTFFSLEADDGTTYGSHVNANLTRAEVEFHAKHFPQRQAMLDRNAGR